MRARVFVTLKPSVFDPQGTTVTEALHTLGYPAVTDVRQGKYFELEIAASTLAPKAALEAIARSQPRTVAEIMESGKLLRWQAELVQSAVQKCLR